MSQDRACQDRRDAIFAAVLGELDAPGAEQLREHLAECPACREFHDALSEQETSISAAFDALASQAVGPGELLRSLSERAAPAGRGVKGGKLWAKFGRPSIGLAAAAIIVVALAIPLAFHKGGPDGAIAWGDVVSAVEEVPQFRVTAFISDDEKESKIEVYFRRPDRWRAYGKGIIQFTAAGKTRLFNIEKKQFVDPATVRFLLLPGDFSRTMGREGILDGVLRVIFRGRVPPGEPARTSGELLGDGLEVFDYAHDPAKLWARIWVLKTSRLPIRVQVYQPEYDDSVLAVFDYSDPQPEGFFDADTFLGLTRKSMPQRPRDWYAVGRKLPPGRKPRSAREIHLFQGYKPPRLMEMAANEAGDLLIVATDPKNRSPRGGSVKGTYHEELWDNWGNLYRRFYRHSPCCPAPGQDTINCMYYTPIGPLRRGEGRHTIALRYVVWDVDTGMSVQRVVSEEAADFPAPTVQGALPQWPPGSDFAAAKRRGLEEHLRSGQTLLKQLDYVEHKLAGRASSAPLIQWKVHLLKELGEDEQAWAFFERTFKDKAIAQPFRSYHSDQMLFDYLSRLWRGGRQEQAMVIIEKLRTASKAQSAARAGASRREVEDARQMLAQSPLLLWLEAPQALKDLSQKPTPKVERIVRSEDGQLCMAVRLPDAARSPLGRPIWGRPTTPPDGPWKDIVSFQKGDLLFMKLKGGGETIALVFDPAVASGTSPLQELRLPWTLEVPVPSATARNAEELEAAFPEWPARQRRASTQPASAFARAKDQARRLFADGEYEQALQWYRKALATPAGELPKMHETEKLNRYLQQRNVLWTHLAVARCLSRLRRFDEARRLLYSLDEKVRDPEAYAALPEPERRGDVFAALGEVISEMVDAGMLNEAEDLLTDIDRARPDFRRLDNLYVATDKPWGRSGRRPRADALRRWGAVDRAWWRLRKARVASSQPAKQAPRPAGGGGVR